MKKTVQMMRRVLLADHRLALLRFSHVAQFERHGGQHWRGADMSADPLAALRLPLRGQYRCYLPCPVPFGAAGLHYATAQALEPAWCATCSSLVLTAVLQGWLMPRALWQQEPPRSGQSEHRSQHQTAYPRWPDALSLQPARSETLHSGTAALREQSCCEAAARSEESARPGKQ